VGVSEQQTMLMFLHVNARRTGCYEVNTCHTTDKSLILGWDSYMNTGAY